MLCDSKADQKDDFRSGLLSDACLDKKTTPLWEYCWAEKSQMNL